MDHLSLEDLESVFQIARLVSLNYLTSLTSSFKIGVCILRSCSNACDSYY